MYGCESWTIKKAVCGRINAFKLWWWWRFLRVPWSAWRLNQSFLKEMNLEYSLEGLILKLQYFGHLIQKADSLEKTLMLGKIEGTTRRGQHRMRWLGNTADSMDMNLSNSGSWWRTGKPGILPPMGSQRAGHDLAAEQNNFQSNSLWMTSLMPYSNSVREILCPFFLCGHWGSEGQQASQVHDISKWKNLSPHFLLPNSILSPSSLPAELAPLMAEA